MTLDWNRKAPWLGLMVFLLALGVTWIAASRVSAEGEDSRDRPPLPRIGFPAPDFTLTTLDGQMITLSALQGRVVLINFWASWCPPCRAEMPAIQQVHELYGDQDLAILAVNVQESNAQAAAFAEGLGLTFHIPMDQDGSQFARYQGKALPSTFLVDRDGVIQNVVIGGPLTRAFIESQATPLLAQEGSR